MLSDKHLKDVCLLGDYTSARCRYLTQDDDDGKYYCVKLYPSKKDEIDFELDNLIKNGRDPDKENVPFGDNCAGYPLLRHIKQGYDV